MLLDDANLLMIITKFNRYLTYFGSVPDNVFLYIYTVNSVLIRKKEIINNNNKKGAYAKNWKYRCMSLYIS